MQIFFSTKDNELIKPINDKHVFLFDLASRYHVVIYHDKQFFTTVFFVSSSAFSENNNVENSQNLTN